MSIATQIAALQTDKTDIANAITTKGGTVTSGNGFDNFASDILTIPTGGGQTEPIAVRFLDFEGTVVQELTQEELDSLTELPSGPDHSEDEISLTFEEWNWTLNEIKTFRTANPDWTVNVGANYHTTDGKCHFIYELPGSYSVSINNSYNYECQIDWGDGSTDTIRSSSATHTYASGGTFHGTVSYTDTYAYGLVPIEFTGSQIYLKYIRYGTKIVSNSGSNIFSSVESVSMSTACTGSYLYYSKVRWVSVPRISGFCEIGWCPNLLYQPMTYSDSVLSNFNLGYCPLIEDIYIGSNKSNIVRCSHNASLKRIRMARQDTITGSSSVFEDNPSLEEFDWPVSWTSVPSYTFNQCYKLRRVSIPEGVTTLEGQCFYSCMNLEELTVPTTVTSLGTNFVMNCNHLTLVMKRTTPPSLAGSNTLNSISKVMVPYSSDHSVLNAYKTANRWSNWADKIFESPEPTA